MIFKCIVALLVVNSICNAAPCNDKVRIVTMPPDVTSVADITADLENWMSLLPKDVRSIPLNYLAIPGSHDSFTVDITKDSDVSPDGADILKQLDFLSIVKEIMANWSKTQGYNVLQQLNAGIRFFDLRFCRNINDEQLYFCHGLYSTKVTSVLTDLASFLDSHPEEVVVLDCQHFYNFTTSTHAQLVQLMKDTFKDKLVPYEPVMTSITLDNLTNQNKQVLMIYRDQDTLINQDLLWPSSSFPTPWYNTMNTSVLISNLDKGLQSKSSNDGYISQLVMTPSVDDYFANLLSTLKRKCAVDFAPLRTQWIMNQTAGQDGVNVIIGDFIDINDNEFSKAVISLNSKINVGKVRNYRFVDRIKSIWSSVRSIF